MLRQLVIISVWGRGQSGQGGQQGVPQQQPSNGAGGGWEDLLPL